MNMEFRYDVTDREEIDGQRGLHVALLFRRSSDQPSKALVGTVSFSDELQIDSTSVEADDLQITSDTGKELVRTACSAAHGDMCRFDLAATGTHWRAVEPWLEQHLGALRAAAVLAELTRFMALLVADGDR